MAFCAVLIPSLLLICEGPENSKFYSWQTRLPSAISDSFDYTSSHNDNGNQMNLENIFEDHYKKINQTTTEELMKFYRPPQTVLDDYANYMTKNYTSTINEAQTTQNQNPQTKVEKTTENTSSTSINNTASVLPNRIYSYVVDGITASFKNWDLSQANQEKPTLLLQWHVGVYSKAFEPYMQICGGTLVTTKAVISAAHCFWSDLEGELPASQFVIAAGKIYRPWNDRHDIYAMKSEVSAVKLPPRFRGGVTSFQDDIAVVLLAAEFTPSAAIRPLCVLFDDHLEYTQLILSGKQGVILGWGLTAENGPPAQALQYLFMPYVPIEECIASVEPNFLKYITSDKICAGVTTGKALCRGDSGGGLVFYDLSTSERVPLLYGVASTAPRNKHLCNTHARASFTRVLAHRGFLRTHIPDIEEACAKNYARFANYTKTGFLDNKLAVYV